MAFWAVFSFLLCASPSLADGLLHGWSNERIAITFTGRGVETGKVLDLRIENKAATPTLVQIPRFTVLEPTDTRYAPVLLESFGGWEIDPGGHLTARLTGYSLEHRKDMPARGVAIDYRPSLGTQQYKPAQWALQEGLKLEKLGKLRPLLLPKEKHRLLVLQRVVWRALGGNNPTGPEELHQDISRALKRKGEPSSEKIVGALAGSVWRDVELIFKSLSAH